MARRIDFNDDDDDDFEIVYDTSSIKTQEIFESIDNDYLEIIPCDNKSPPLINTNPIVEKSIKIENEIINKVKPSLSMSSSCLPNRYGSAAAIPYEESFDPKLILNSKPIIPLNDITTFLDDVKLQKRPSINNDFNELLLNHARDRANLVQIAKQAQQDFLNAINLD